VTGSQAEALTAKLMAAFPSPIVDPLTVDVYRERIESFPSYERALDALNELIGTETFRPPVALLVDAYWRHNERHQERIMQIEPPEPTPEERELNLRMAREWAARVKGLTDSMEMP
jgi:hypothetical protein